MKDDGRVGDGQVARHAAVQLYRCSAAAVQGDGTNLIFAHVNPAATPSYGAAVFVNTGRQVLFTADYRSREGSTTTSGFRE